MNRSLLPFSRIFRKLERDMETVVKVLQPGPLGIIEHKFSAVEIHKANATVQRAVECNPRADESILKRLYSEVKDLLKPFFMGN